MTTMSNSTTWLIKKFRSKFCYYTFDSQNILSNIPKIVWKILYNNFLHGFNVFLGCWRAETSWPAIFSTFCEELLPLIYIFLLTVDPPNVAVNILSPLEHLILLLTQNRFSDPCFLMVKKPPSTSKHVLPLCLLKAN